MYNVLDMPLSPGNKLGPYEIVAPLGAGGMGEVWRAHDTRLNREVAIKTLPAALADDANRMARLQREAQVLASLSHPGIASIFGLEEAGGGRALVMELVEGPTLAERIATGPIPLDEALALARQIADALEAAHEKGIVHRDLKPANIKLTANNKVKVLDFGLAKAFEGEAASGNLTNSPTLTLEATRAGVIMGTAGYMSPEQARGKPVDKRADIWAFGVVLFEMLSGKTTFEGETVSDTLAAVLRADIDWKQLPAGTPPKVRRLLQRCLERDRSKRLRDIGDAWIEIDSPDEPAAAAPVQSRKNAAWWLGWAAAILIGAAGLGWALLHRTSPEPRPVVRWTYSQKAYFGIPVLSHDGTRLEFSELAGASPRLALRMMDQVDAKPLPGADDTYFGDFSPDGEWIVAFVGQTDAKLKKIPVTGGTAITLADAAVPSGVSWGDDGTIVFNSGKGLVRISSSGGAPETLTTPDSKKGETSHRTPHYLPGSRALLFTIVSGTRTQVAVLDLKKRAYRVVVGNGQDARYVPTGHLIYERGNTLFAVPFDAGKLAVAGSEAPVVEAVSLNGPSSGIAEYTVSDSGLLVYMEGALQGRGTTMAWVDPQGQTQPISDTVLWGTGRLSPDGRRIANGIYVSTTTAGSPQDLWVFDTERKIKTRVTFGGANSSPIWTPDGRRITYSATADGKSGIYWVPADGSGKPEQLLATDAVPTPSSWSPDGKLLLYFQSAGQKPARIFVLPVSGGVAGKPYPLHDTEAYEVDAQVSPDGRWVAYVSSETGQSEVYLQPFPGPGGKERVSTQGGDSVRWAHNSRELYYRVTTGEGAIMAVDVETSPQLHLGLPRTLTKGVFGTTFDVAPDGKRFLVELIGGLDPGGRRMVGIDNWFEELKRRVPVK
jgi:serine/threonine-protein kinase